MVVKEVFTDYKEFQRGAKNHLILNRYRLGNGPFYGVHSGIQLFNMQIGHADRYEGVMNDGIPPKTCVTIAVVQKAEGTVCVDRMPLREGDVIIVDDHTAYRFASSGRARLAIGSIRKMLFEKHGLSIEGLLPAAFHDENGAFAALIDRLWAEGERWKAGDYGAAGGAGASGINPNRTYDLYMITDAGVSATFSAAMIHVRPVTIEH